MLTAKERLSAARSLIDWFKSQDLRPSDAIAVMTTLMAIAITDKTKNQKRLEEAAELVKQLYLTDIDEQLRLREMMGR